MAVRSSSVLSSTVSKDERHGSPEKEVWGGFSLFTPFPKEAFKFPLENSCNHTGKWCVKGWGSNRP